MALANYTDLQASIITWATRTGDADFLATVPDIVRIGEARLNRELGAIESDATLTGTIDNRRISLAAVAWVVPIALFQTYASGSERGPLQKQPDGAYSYSETSGEPDIWSMDGNNIDFHRPLGAAYTFRFRYREKFNLATTSTNWLLTEHPDIYLAAMLIWGAGWNEDVPNYAFWKNTLDEGIPSVNGIISLRNRGTLRVDPALQRQQRYDARTDQ